MTLVWLTSVQVAAFELAKQATQAAGVALFLKYPGRQEVIVLTVPSVQVAALELAKQAVQALLVVSKKNPGKQELTVNVLVAVKTPV